MKTLIIYHSEHHGNTKKIAEAMAEKVGADIVKAEDVNTIEIDIYDILGFGSGVYNGRLHNELSEFIRQLPRQENNRSFIFSTTGSKTYASMAHERFKKELEEIGLEVIGEFSCLGLDTALTTEGINKGKPDKQDIKDSEDFIVSIINL